MLSERKFLWGLLLKRITVAVPIGMPDVGPWFGSQTHLKVLSRKSGGGEDFFSKRESLAAWRWSKTTEFRAFFKSIKFPANPRQCYGSSIATKRVLGGNDEVWKSGKLG